MVKFAKSTREHASTGELALRLHSSNGAGDWNKAKLSPSSTGEYSVTPPPFGHPDHELHFVDA